MAQQYLDFEDATVAGDAIAYEAWSPSTSSPLGLGSDPASVGWLTVPSGALRFAKILDAINSNEIEVYGEVIPSGGESDIYVGGNLGRNAYKFDIRQVANQIRISKFVAGSETSGLSTVSKTIPSGTLHSLRARWSAATNQLKLRVWQTADPEPVSWDIEITDTSLAESGTVGLFTFGAAFTYSVIGIGTDGDSAPSSALSGPSTPINLSITSLLATSARLNWEQG